MTNSVLSPSHVLDSTYIDWSLDKLQSVQQVYIADYALLKDEIERTSAKIRNAEDQTRKLRTQLSRDVARKVRILEEINAMGRAIDRLDGTIPA